MNDNLKKTYDMDELDAEAIAALDDRALGELVRDLVHTLMPHSHRGLLEGAFEMAEEDAVTALREAAWSTVNLPDVESPLARDLIDTKADEELQEILGAALTAAEKRGDPAIFDPVRQLGPDSCTVLAMEIEDWQTRYDCDEGVDY